MPDAPVRGGRREADHIQQRAAPHAEQVGVAVNVIAVNLRVDFRDVEVGVFHPLAALDDDGRADQLERIAVDGEVVGDGPFQSGLRLRERFV